MRRFSVPLAPSPVRWSLLLVAAAVVWYASVAVDPGPGTLPTPWGDKFLHAIGYAVLAFLGAYATANRRDLPSRRGLAVLLGTVGYGAVIELVQSTVAYRQCDPADAVANAAGALLVVGWFALERYVSYRHVDRSGLW